MRKQHYTREDIISKTTNFLLPYQNVHVNNLKLEIKDDSFKRFISK